MQRYSPRPFPPYRYTPGQNPHPVIDEDGHSYGHEEEAVEFEPQRWKESDDYLYGIDLLNHGYFWEAHEAFEGIWHHLGRKDENSRFIQGLILLAVSCLHLRRGRMSAVKKVATKGLNKLEGLDTCFFGCQTFVICSYLQLLQNGESIKVDIRLM